MGSRGEKNCRVRHRRVFETLKIEFRSQVANLNDETCQLENYRKRLENGVAGCEKPLEAANHCLGLREGRVNIDLVHDDVQKELLTEVSVVNGVCAMLERALEQVIEQIRLNRSSAYHLQIVKK